MGTTNSLPTDSDQPFSYRRTHDLKDQKVIFNSIGLCDFSPRQNPNSIQPHWT